MRTNYVRDFDWILLLTALALVAVGVAFIWSAAYEYNPYGESFARDYAQAQARWLVVSLAAFAFVLFFDYQLYYRLAYLGYGLGMLLLVSLWLFGQTRGNATRWIAIGPYLLQPSELMKIAVILALARFLTFRKDYREIRGLFRPFLLMFVPMAVILVQPDLGTALVLLPVMFAMLYMAGARARHLWLAVALGIASAPVMWFTVMSTVQKQRITSFIMPQADRFGAGYHAVQSVAAVASGGLSGKGFAMGAHHLLDLLPAAHTDFIFAVIAEEWGFVGGVLVLALFFVLFARCARIAERTREPFGRLVVVGGLTLFAFQTVVNVGMTMRLCPITGLTLPFVSYGGSSLLSSFIILGLIMNVGLRRKSVVAPDDFA